MARSTQRRDGVLRADKFTLSKKAITCGLRFHARTGLPDINELECNALGGKTGEKPKTIKDELILKGDQSPYTMTIMVNGKPNVISNQVTHFHFDSTFNIAEVARETARLTGEKRIRIAGFSFAQPAIEGLDYFVQKAHTHFSSPKEVARLVTAIRHPEELLKLDIGKTTKELVEIAEQKAGCRDVPKGKKGKTKVVCDKPVLFLTWRENGDTQAKAIPLDPTKRSHGEIIFSNQSEIGCSIPGAIAKLPLVTTAIRDLLSRPVCFAPPIAEVKK